MNFVFILDTSLSMNQTFEGSSYFDISKSCIRNFVLNREINNSKQNRKSDKYFLINLNEKLDESLICNWLTTTEHFLIHLNELKNTCDFTNIDFAIKNSFNMLNTIKKIGDEKHVYGRLFSKIQNSFILVFTDGGIISSKEQIKPKHGCEDSLLYLIDEDRNIFKNEEDYKKIIPAEINYPSIYKELYRWDQSLYFIVLNGKNNDYESSEIYDKMCRNIGGKVIIGDSSELLNKKLLDLSNKVFMNNRVYISFYINKLKKKNYTTSLEYSGNIDKMNEKWPFPDELILNKSNVNLPVKRAIPNYEFGGIKYNFQLSSDYYDEYDIKDKKFILILLTNGDCCTNLLLSDFLKQYKTSFVIDILIYDLKDKDKKNYKKPFGLICFYFTKELIDCMSQVIITNPETTLSKFFTDCQSNNMIFYNENNTNNKLYIINYIKCKFYNLPYYYTEFISLIQRFGNQKINDVIEFQMNLEKYWENIPFYYRDHIANFLEKNKILKLDREKINKQIIKNYFSDQVMNEIDILTKYEKKQITEINRLFTQNRKKHADRKALCCARENLYGNIYNTNNISNNMNNNLNNKSNLFDTGNNDDEYLRFINKVFKLDNINQNNSYKNTIKNNNISNINYTYYQNKTRYDNQNRNLIDEMNHTVDIEFMGDCSRDFLLRADKAKSYLIPEIEIRYLIKDLFGNQFIERKTAYSSKQIKNPSFENELAQECCFLPYSESQNDSMNIEDNTNLNNSSNNSNSNSNSNFSIIINDNKNINNKNLINLKRKRDKSMDDINLRKNNNSTTSTDVSETQSNISLNSIMKESNSDIEDNIDIDEKKYNSKISELIEEFKNPVFDKNGGVPGETVNVQVNFKISDEQLFKWKLRKIVKKYSKELIKCLHTDDDKIISLIKDIIKQSYLFMDKKLAFGFITKVYSLSQAHGVNITLQNRIKKLSELYT